MPGLVGFTINNVLLSEDNYQNILKMQKSIIHHDFYCKDELFCDDCICASRAHTNIVNRNLQPYFKDDIYIWLDGEFYNQEQLLSSGEECSDPQLLYQLYTSNTDFSFLKTIDGFYSAVIYDKKKKNVHLLTDRYGLKHIYWTINNGQLVWASEIKAFLALKEFDPVIDRKAVSNFFEVGYLIDDQTWFEGVELLFAGTVLSWNMCKQTIQKKSYWSWDEIKPITEKINEDEIAQELGNLFLDSVKNRCHKGEKIGLGLSGGLDSRAILAAIPQGLIPYTMTMGKTNSSDIKIAQKVAKLKSVPHQVVELNEKNWLMPRLNGIWWTDGQLNLLHMHGIETLINLKEFYDINLNGFLGDAVLGGSYLGDPDKPIIWKINNRGRRFIILGIKISDTILCSRLSFFDNTLIERTLAIPEGLRKNSYIYNKMLLKMFPQYYKSIPWQKTGIPISYPKIITAILIFLLKAKNKVLRKLSYYLGFNTIAYSFTDYPNWIRQEPACSFFKEVLHNNTAIYPEYISRQDVINKLEEHLAGKDHAEKLCSYLTFEIWLQQVFNGKYRGCQHE